MSIKRIFFFLFFISAMLSTSYAGGIDFFHGTWQEALEKAQDEGKIVFVDAYTTWCGPCKRMSRTVFTQESVGDYFNQYFVNIKVDMEKPNGQEFGAKYPVSAYPTLFFLEPTGKLIKKSVGGKQVQQLVDLGTEVVSKFDYSAKERKLYEQGDRSFNTVIAYIDGLNKSGKSSLKIANDYLDSDHGMTEQQLTQFLFSSATEVDSEIFEMMLSQKKAIIAKYGNEDFRSKVLSAAQRTADKSMEFDDENLMQLAVATVKKQASKSQSAQFINKTKMDQAVAQKNSKAYTKALKLNFKYLDSMKDIAPLANKSLQIFPKDKDLLKLLEKTVKPYMSSSSTKEEVALFVKILLDSGDKEGALAYAKKSEDFFTDQATKNYIKSLIKYVENYQA